MAIFSLCSHMTKREIISLISLIRALIPFMKATSSWPNCLPKAPPPKTITLLHMNLGGEHKHSVYSTYTIKALTLGNDTHAFLAFLSLWLVYIFWGFPWEGTRCWFQSSYSHSPHFCTQYALFIQFAVVDNEASHQKLHPVFAASQVRSIYWVCSMHVTFIWICAGDLRMNKTRWGRILRKTIREDKAQRHPYSYYSTGTWLKSQDHP